MARRLPIKATAVSTSRRTLIAVFSGLASCGAVSEFRKHVLGTIFTSSAFASYGLLLSLQPTFYPTEAEIHGATPSQYGFVFGCSSLAAFLFGPIFGTYGERIGPKLLFNLGGLTQGLVGIAFGSLDYIENTAAFIGLSYTLRLIEGVANAATASQGVGILMMFFPGRQALVTSYTEMFLGLGFMVGPPIGSVLYQYGGFTAPFYVIGSLTTVVAVVLILLVPKMKVGQESQDSNDKGDGEKKQLSSGGGTKKLSFLEIIKSPALSFPFVDNALCSAGYGMVESFLEPHLKNSEANATQTEVGIVFLIVGAAYTVTTIPTGTIADRMKYPTIISIIGNSFLLISFLLLGPASFFQNLLPLVNLTFGMAAMMGVGYGLVLVSSAARVYKTAIAKGFDDDINTYVLIAGMWSASFNLGTFLSPTLSGFVVEAVGFRKTTVTFLPVFAVALSGNFIELANNVRQARTHKRQEYVEFE